MVEERKIQRFSVKKFRAFCIVGCAVTGVDYLLIHIMSAANIHPTIARIPAFFCASYVSWFLNSRFTFHSSGQLSGRSFFKYLIFMWLGFLVNYIIFISVYFWGGRFAGCISVAFVFATAVSMTMNFLNASRVLEK